MQPQISVIVPVYNCEKHIGAAIASILSQHNVEIEIIAVNDGSTDRSGQVLGYFEKIDSRVRVFHQENSGVASARNLALQQARGEWLAFCDGDDMVPEGAYAALLDRSDGVDIVIGAYRNRRDCGPSEIHTLTSTQKKGIFTALMAVPCVWTKLIRASFLKHHLLAFPDILLGEDVVFLGEVAAARPRCSVTNSIVYDHWHHELDAAPSLVHTYDFKHFEAHIDCRVRLSRICTQTDLPGCTDYIYLSMSPFLAEFLLCIVEAAERRAAFALLKEFLGNYDWTKQGPFFEGCFGVPWEEFQQETAEQYFTRVLRLPPQERVLRQFEVGQIGFRYLWRYLNAWSTYKIRGRKRRYGGIGGTGPNG